MRMINPRYELLTYLDQQSVCSKIANCARICYNSDKIGGNRAFVRTLMDDGHLSMLEHASISVKFTIDRDVSHELVRHRLASFSQESSQHVDYQHEIEFITPSWMIGVADGEVINSSPAVVDTTRGAFLKALLDAEKVYRQLRESKWSKQEARAVLPNALATRIVVTANLREWMRIFKLRTTKQAHPQMQRIMIPLQVEFTEKLPIIFGDNNTLTRGRVGYGR